MISLRLVVGFFDLLLSPFYLAGYCLLPERWLRGPRASALDFSSELE